MPRSWFARFFSRSDSEVRLRHVLHLGALIEKQAASFYHQFAKNANNSEVKELCLALADQEAQHFKFIQERLSRWKSLPINADNLEAMDADGWFHRLFLSPPESDTSTRAMVTYAIEEERNMVDFYRNFDKEIYNEWKRMKLWEMVEEEVKHVAILEDFLSNYEFEE